MFRSAGCSRLRAESFSCRLDVHYGGLIAICDQENINFFSAVNLFKFLVIKTWVPNWIRIHTQPKINESGSVTLIIRQTKK
jgi:hypothetical protein